MKPFIESPEEGNVLLGLLDLAVKAGGLNTASNCLHFANKTQMEMQALNEAQRQPPATAPAPAPAAAEAPAPAA